MERARAALGNVYNSFELLGHTQFVEQRVHEDDGCTETARLGAASKAGTSPGLGVGGCSCSSQSSTLGVEAGVATDYALLVSQGLQAMASAGGLVRGAQLEAHSDYDTTALHGATAVQVMDDSEGEALALPFVIGTPEFNADEHCGLVEARVAHAAAAFRALLLHSTCAYEWSRAAAGLKTSALAVVNTVICLSTFALASFACLPPLFRLLAARYLT
eukprot:3562322-Pleurochrysis_carterae.AAC.8